MWFPIGFAVVYPTDQEVTLGRFEGVLPDGLLHLQLAYRGPGSPDRFSFCIVDFLDDDGTRSLGSDKWWPRSQPSTVRLGPGTSATVAGNLLLRPRRFNTDWLEAGLPGPTLPVSVSAWLQDGAALARFIPNGFDTGLGVHDVANLPVGPGGAHPIEGPYG